MSKVLCVSSNLCTAPYAVYPLGMATIAGALNKAGHHVRQFDFLVAGECEEKLVAVLREAAPDIICMSIRNIDDTDSTTGEDGWFVAGAKMLVDIIRAGTSAPIIVGGPAVSIMPEEMLEYLGADYAVVGEGEGVLCDLISELEQNKVPARIMQGKDCPLVGAEMVSPVHDAEILKFYEEQSLVLGVQTKRGCPMACTYCTYPALEGHRFRKREPGEVVDEIVHARKVYHGEFFFVDSVLNDADGHYLQVAEEIIRRKLDIKWSAYFSPRGVTREAIALCKRAGLRGIEFGTDACSDTTLSELRKGFTWEDVVSANDACVAHRVPCAHFIMFGGPGETRETIEEGLVNIAQLQNCVVIAFLGIRVFPGTPLRDRALADGLIAEGDSLLKPAYYISPHVEADWVNERISDAWSRSRDRLFPPSKSEDVQDVMRSLGYKGILWDKLIGFPRGGGEPPLAGSRGEV